MNVRDGVRHVVLGSEGFIGKLLVNSLKAQGKWVVGWDIKKGPNQDCRKVELGLTALDIVYFLAWEVGGSRYLYSADTQLEQLENNLALMRNVFGQLQKSKSKFVFISSQLAETRSVYGLQKSVGECWTKLLCGHCLRLWNVYGPVEKRSQRSHIVGDLVEQGLLTGKIKLETTGEEERQFVHVDDVCVAVEHALESEELVVSDVTSLKWISMKKLACMVSLILGVPLEIGKQVGRNNGGVVRMPLKGWQCSIGLETGLRRTIAEYRSKYGL